MIFDSNPPLLPLPCVAIVVAATSNCQFPSCRFRLPFFLITYSYIYLYVPTFTYSNCKTKLSYVLRRRIVRLRTSTRVARHFLIPVSFILENDASCVRTALRVYGFSFQLYIHIHTSFEFFKISRSILKERALQTHHHSSVVFSFDRRSA